MLFFFLSNLDGNNCSFIPRLFSVPPSCNIKHNLLLKKFCVGDCIYSEDMAPRVKLAYDNGFQVASHTWSHAYLSKLSPEEGKSFFSSSAFVRW
jgi:hypothetical protein